MAINPYQIRDLLRPGVYGWQGRCGADPLHPVKELDIFVIEHEDGIVHRSEIVVRAHNKDGATTTETLSNKAIETEGGIVKEFRRAMDVVCPVSIFHDEIVIAYDDSGWLHGDEPQPTVWAANRPIARKEAARAVSPSWWRRFFPWLERARHQPHRE